MKKILFLLLATLFVMQGWSQSTPATIPWACNFEDPTENANWTLDNGACINKWVIGTAVSSGAITGSSLYISNDEGVNNAYSVAGTASFNVVIATRTIVSSGADNYLLSFDWKCAAESNWDFFRVFLVDESDTSFVASNSSTAPGYANNGFASRNVLTAGGIAGVVTTNTLYPTHANILNGYIGSTTTYITATQHVDVELPSMGASGTVKKLIIVWRNDGSGGVQPPAALDNFSINVITCYAPNAVTVPMATITTDNAVVNWTAVAEAQKYVIQWKPSSASSWDDPVVESGNTTDTFFNVQNLTASTQYNVRVRTVCDIGVDSSWWITTDFYSDCAAFTTFPFKETFEDTSASRNCWRIIDANSDGDAWAFSSSSLYAHGGSSFVQMYTDGNAGNNNDWLISPAITLSSTATLKYWYRARSATQPDAFEVLVSTTGNQPADFTYTLLPFTEFSNIAYQQTKIDLSAYIDSTIYIAWHVPQGGPDGYYIYVDDIEIIDCEVPYNIQVPVETLTATSANIFWSGASPSNTWNIAIYANATTTPTVNGGDIANGTVNTKSFSTAILTAENTYYVYIQSVCDATWSSYTFTTPAACPTPTGLTLANVNAVTGEATLSWNALGATSWNIKISSAVLIDPENETADIENAGAATGTPQFLITGLTIGSAYYCYVQSICGGAWANHSFVFDYCTPAPSSSGVDGDGITNVSFGSTLTVNNTTGAEVGDYGNYSSMTGTVASGLNLVVAITYSTGYTYGTKIWIDTNQNLIFDANELLYTGLSASPNPTTLIATIPIPASLPLGNYRMRIGGTDADTGPTGPCIIGSYGCMEDYTVQVIETPACMPIGTLTISNLTATEATASWIASVTAPANGYQVLVSTSATAPTGTEDEIQAVTDTFLLISNLAPVTSYYVWVRSHCGNEEYSIWMSVNFTTPCAEFSIPYVQNFDANTNMPSCWNMFGSLVISTNNSTSPPNTLRFNGQGTNVAALPVFDVDVNTAKISFILRRESINSSGPMDIGYLTNVSDASSFVAVMTNILTAEGVNTPFDTALSAFPAGIKNIAFRQTTTNNYWYWLDNVFVYDPNCMPVNAFAAQNITATSADITWSDDNSPSTSWNVEIYSTAQSNPTVGGGNILTTTVSNTGINITDLTPNTTYYLYVKNDCGWASYSFATPCMATSIPYTQNFDANANMPSCWNTFGSLTIASGGYPTSEPHTLRFSGNGTNIAVLPIFDVDVNTAKISFVLQREDMASSGTMDIGYLTNLTNANSFVAVMTDILTVEDVNISFDTALSAFPAGIKNIAFRQIATINWYYWLDNVYVYDPNCVPVTAFAAQNLTTTSADITWSDNNSPSTSWHVELYSTAQENPTVGGGDILTTTVSDTGVNITNLTMGTTYYLYVKNDCGWSDYSFTTECVLVTLPYTQNFDLNIDLPNCWTMFGHFIVKDSYATSEPNTLRFEGGGINIAALPVFDVDVNTARLGFVLRKEHIANSGAMDIGYLTNMSDESSFVAVMTNILIVANANTPFDTALSAFPAGITNIAFRQTTALGYFYWLDNVNVYAAPITCYAPTALNSTTLTHTAATITWTAGDAETEWQVAWKEAAASDWNNIAGASAIPYDISGLAASTDYEAKVRAICGASDTSNWSEAITFTTLTCFAPTNITTTAITANSITVTWQPMNGETDWKVSWKNTSTGDLGSGTAHNNDNEGYSIIDLVVNTEYQICVTAVCAEGVESSTICIYASTSGIHDITLANSLQLYPNPTTGELRIKNYEFQEGDKIEIYNVLGQKQQLTTNHYPLTTIDVSHLSAGIYTVKIGGYVGKFVKK